MRLFLDTTIQIDRIFGSRKKKAAIRAACEGHTCCCSTYVLGEFYATIIKDAVDIYHILWGEDNLNEAERRVSELARNRRSERMHLLFIQLRDLYQNNLDEIRCEVQSYLEDLLHMFHRGLEETLGDATQCQRGRARLVMEEGLPILEGAGCRKDSCRCEVEAFWKDNQPLLEDVTFPDTLQEKPAQLLHAIRQGKYNNIKGNSCRTLGDSIITLEARAAADGICTTNRADYQPLCDLFQTSLCCPDYSAVFQKPTFS